MNVLRIDKYNNQQTAKWNNDYDKARYDGRHWSCMPQLAFYIFEKNRGYVAFEGSKALWHKTKKGVIVWWNEEEEKKKIRGW